MALLRVMLLLLGSLLGGSWGRRLICWQAMMRCQEEAECSYAYRQYVDACSSVLPRPGGEAASSSSSSSSSSRRRCPSHCISALIQLNHTRWGPALEDCDCAMDETCRATKRAVEPCMPRTSRDSGAGSTSNGRGVMGCMEARKLCEGDWRCGMSLSRYLTKCGRLFDGLRCTDECKEVIEDMMRVPKAMLLSECECDGHERPICESIKENMARLCFGLDLANAGPGSSGRSEYDYDDEEDYADEPGTKEGSYEYYPQPSGKAGDQDGASRGSQNGARTVASAWTAYMMLLAIVLSLPVL
ncbi:growth arrest-specific protein 1 [Xenopus laevis]|uniref:GDNF/GAS1 domain-containing protein n=2 Tax=Xenopus laevis TaxID=8355 RepID=A0A974DTZ1_XENLA|nr:growth arrest-specific protein 1 [Xenopus laevis]OCT97933.1 hypothetical protein XELAEV_18010162mg [Xenopus laevis]